MTRFAALLAAALLAAPALAKSSRAKGPRNGQFCGKSAIGSSTQDASGNTLECKAGRKGRARWTKK